MTILKLYVSVLYNQSTYSYNKSVPTYGILQSIILDYYGVK